MKVKKLQFPSHMFKHGKSHTPIHNAWLRMKGRCYNIKNIRYKDYGGRGIKVCARWRYSFEDFYADMMDIPKGKSIDRIDNDLHYSCGKCKECIKRGWRKNCKWSTNKEHARNRRSNRRITYRGETKLLMEWSEKLKINRETIANRLDRFGWSIQEALTLPVRKGLYNRRCYGK